MRLGELHIAESREDKKNLTLNTTYANHGRLGSSIHLFNSDNLVVSDMQAGKKRLELNFQTKYLLLWRIVILVGTLLDTNEMSIRETQLFSVLVVEVLRNSLVQVRNYVGVGSGLVEALELDVVHKERLNFCRTFNSILRVFSSG